MIKQNWNISQEEKLRILGLHENATKGLYLMNEQWIIDNKPNKRSKEPLSINPATLEGPEGNLPKMGEIPKNVQFGFPMRKFQKPGAVDSVTDDKGNVFFSWDGRWRKLPAIQDIGLPKFLPFETNFLQGVEEWEWLNSFNDWLVIPRTNQDFGIYVPAYDKNNLSLHFLRYTLRTIKKTKGRVESEDYLQADDNKFISDEGVNLIVVGEDIPLGGNNSIPSPTDVPPKKVPPQEKPLELNISNPFNFDQVTLTPEGQAQFDQFVENLKKYLKYYSGNVEVITSASIDADPESKKEYNMRLSERRADAIIAELKKRLGETSLNFIAKPLGQTDQFAPGMKWPEVKDNSKTAENRRLIIKLPKINVQEK